MSGILAISLDGHLVALTRNQKLTQERRYRQSTTAVCGKSMGIRGGT